MQQGDPKYSKVVGWIQWIYATNLQGFKWVCGPPCSV